MKIKILIFVLIIFLMKKIVLITGAAGFLGSHLSEKFADLGHEVIGIDNMTGGYDDNISKKIRSYKIDCCNFEKVNSRRIIITAPLERLITSINMAFVYLFNEIA